MNTSERIDHLAQACSGVSEYIGIVTTDNLKLWLKLELGNSNILDSFQPYGDKGNLRTKAVAPSAILHIVSDNTPHAAFQSIIRGLLVGSHNLVKIPRGGASSELKAVIDWHHQLPEPLQNMVVIQEETSTSWWDQAEVIIAIGSDTSIKDIFNKLKPHQKFIPHGHKLSIAYVAHTSQASQESTEHTPDSLENIIAEEVSAFNQHGCLSPHAIYVNAEQPDIIALCERLAKSLAELEINHPRGDISLSESGSIYNLRQNIKYLTSNGEQCQLWASDDTSWTIVYEADPTLKTSPKNRTIYIKPWPKDHTLLGDNLRYLSTCAVYPWDETSIDEISCLNAPRLCALGKAQQPSLFWHHDGFATLASLVSWRDIG